MFSPLVTAEFPTYDEAFAHTQAYAIENGIGLRSAQTIVKRAALSATRTCAATADPTRRIVSRTSLSRKIGSASVALPKQPVSTPLGSSTLRRDIESTVDGDR